MPLDQAFRLSAILLAATSVASLIVATVLPAWLLMVVGAAFVSACLRARDGDDTTRWSPSLRLSALTWNIFLLAAFVGFWIDLLLLSQELLPAGIHFLLLLLVNKLSNLDQRRDFLHLYAISLIALLVSAALTAHVWYAPFFLLYLAAGVWTLLLYHLVKERDEPIDPSRPALAPPASAVTPTTITPRFFWATNGLALGAFGLTVLFFFFIPRIGVGLLQHQQGDRLRTTGFTEQVDLGAIGPVKQDPSVVMRVELPDAEGDRIAREPLYLRGVAYNRYDGKAWSNTLPHRRMLTEVLQGTFTLRPVSGHTASPPATGLRQDILLEPLDTAVLFGAPFPMSVTGEFLSIQGDLMGSLHLPFPPHQRLHYTVYSQPTAVLAAEQRMDAVRYPDAVLRQYLTLPDMDQRVLELAQRIAQPGRSVLERVRLIHRHLLTQYRYNLDVPSLESAHPLEDFLLTRKTGYCEHYATAMVILLRAVGIPARLVTGFLAVEWNAFGRYYTVRQQDAHAWVEVYFPQSGWITMDPTPPAPAAAAPAWWHSAAGLLDSARLKWDRLFVHYSAGDQFAVVQGLKESGEAMRLRMSDSLSRVVTYSRTLMKRSLTAIPSTGLTQILALLLLAAGLGYGMTHLHRKGRAAAGTQTGHSADQQSAITFYQAMLQDCARQGLAKSPHATAGEFLSVVRAQWREAGPAVERLTELYQRARFGHSTLSDEERATAGNLLSHLSRLRRQADVSSRR